MKAILETITNAQVHCTIDMAESPVGIMKRLYQENEPAATQFFANETAISQLMAGDVDTAQSTFELQAVDGNTLHVDWKTPLCNQPEIKEEIARIESEGQVPTFVVGVSSIVA